MKNKINTKEKSGITLTMLILTITLMLILIPITTYGILNYIKSKKISEQFEFMQWVQKQTDNYYLINNELPVINLPAGRNDMIRQAHTLMLEKYNRIKGVSQRLKQDSTENYALLEVDRLGEIPPYFENTIDKNNIPFTYIFLVNKVTNVVYIIKQPDNRMSVFENVIASKEIQEGTRDKENGN